MKKTETGKLLAIIAAAYPTRFEVSDLAGEVWHGMLGDLDYEIVQIAAKKHILSSAFPPSIAEIRQKAVEIMRPYRPGAAGAWESVNRALDKHGYYQAAEGMASLSPLAARVVRMIGWTRMCLSQNLGVERGQFMRIYDEMRERQEAEQLLPEALKAQISALADKPTLKEGGAMAYSPGYDKAS